MLGIRHWRSQVLALQGAKYNYDVDRALQHTQRAESLMQKGRIVFLSSDTKHCKINIK